MRLSKENQEFKHLTYQSLITKENINHYLSIITDQQVKQDFLTTVSKFDIRISTKPVIRGDEFFYKIWILKRGTKKRAHIKEYYPLESLQEKKFNDSLPPISLEQIFWMIRINADVPDDFEEYCEIHLEDPSDPICRLDYLDNLRRAARFKKFMTQDEIRSFPFSLGEFETDPKNNLYEELKDEYNLDLIGFTIVVLEDKKEYDKLEDLKNTLDYYDKITQSYGYDKYTGELNEKLFPVTKDDKQMKEIVKNIDNYNKALTQLKDYLKQLNNKYNIKPSGNINKRLAFKLNEKIEPKQNSKYLQIVIDNTYFY